MEVFVVEATDDIGGYGVLVGAYSSFDKGVVAADAYSAWVGPPSGGFLMTRLLTDHNNVETPGPRNNFQLRPGCVPEWFLRKSEFKDRYAAAPNPHP